MGQLRNANLGDQQAFPGCDFAAVDAIPLPQCTTYTFSGVGGRTIAGPFALLDAGPFGFVNLNEDLCHITRNDGGNTGLFHITVTQDTSLRFTANPGVGINTEWHVQPSVPPVPNGLNAVTNGPAMQLTDPVKFGGPGVDDRICHITVSPTGNTGLFPIISHSPVSIFFDQDPGTSINVEYHIDPAVPLEGPQTIQEMSRLAQIQGAATTIKGGQLFIDGVLANLNTSCPIILNPA